MTALSLFEDLLAPGQAVLLPPVERLLYVASGHVSGGVSLAAGEAWQGEDEVELEAGDEGATVLRFELTEWSVETAKITVPVTIDPWVARVLRSERVSSDLPALGPGIGCLLAGELEAGGRILGPLDAWAEPAELAGEADVLRVSVAALE